ncbi:MAG TPA: porin [Bacteroidetes bacterium]|jgi:hypothetical protein|nr:porin [Bacteroidota bacterium]
MKKILHILLFICLPAAVIAQQPKLDKYVLGEGLTFNGSKGYSLKIGGFVQPFIESKFYSNDSTKDVYNRFRMRRLRLRLSGDIPEYKMDYRFQIDLSGISEVGDATASNFLMDAWIAYNPNKQIQLKFGQSASLTDNRELTMGSHTLQLPERSRLTSSFSTIREFGLFASGNYRTGGGTYLRPFLAITNGDGINVFGKDHGGLKVGGRIDFLPFGLFTNFGQYRQADLVRELTPKLIMGVNYSVNSGMSSRRGRESGTILYLDNNLNESLPDFTKYGFDFLFKYKGFSMLGEFVKTTATVPSDIIYRVRVDGSIATTFNVNGVQDMPNYVKGRMMLGEGYNIQAGYVYKKKYSIDARYTHLEADQNSFLNNGTFYNRPNYYTLGLSRYFTRNYGFKVQASITYGDLGPGSLDVIGLPREGTEWTGRIITSIAF